MGVPSHLKIALIQMATGANKAHNLAVAAERIKAAASHGASLVVLPECFNSPYGLKFFREYAEPATPKGPSYAMLSAAAKESKVYLVGGSIPEKGSDKDLDGSFKLYNTSLVFGPDGSCIATHRKVHLFDIDVPGGVSFKESAVLSPGNQLTTFQTPWGRIGLGICYDIRFPEQTLLAARKEGVSAMLFPGESLWRAIVAHCCNIRACSLNLLIPNRSVQHDYWTSALGAPSQV